MVLVRSVGVGWVEWAGRCRAECNVVELADPQHKRNAHACKTLQSHELVRSGSCRSIVYIYIYIYICIYMYI